MNSDLKPGTQLMTKDGRLFGNAVIVDTIDSSEPFSGQSVFKLECDNGLVQDMTLAEIKRLFFIKDRQGFVRVANYPDWVEERRARILKNRTFLKKFKEVASTQPEQEIFPTDPISPSEAVQGDSTLEELLEELEQVGT